MVISNDNGLSALVTNDNVIQFIKNLDYIELYTTEDQVFIQMPVRTIITLRS